MLLPESNIEIKRSGEIRESSFGISEGNEAHILGILRNKLYTDKIGAVVREYPTNGLDAHQLVGKEDIPIEVSLPNALFPNFKVRDFGPGLSEEDIRNIFTKYGASTKRDSNKQIGGLGIGCKAAFSYSDAFSVISINEEEGIRVKRNYAAYIDETGIGKIGKLLEQIDTDEPCGIEISIPVQANDYRAFLATAERTFKFFKVKPKILNGVINYKEEEISVQGEDWYYTSYDNRDNGYVIMGQIGYPINSNLFLQQAYPNSHIYNHTDYEERRNTQYELVNVRLQFNIGDLNISANREALEYDAKTIKSIKERLNSIKRDINIICQKEIDKEETLLNARKKANELYKKFHWYNNELKWKDFKLERNKINTLITIPIGVAGYWYDSKFCKIYYWKDEVGTKETSIGLDASSFKSFENFQIAIKTPETKLWKTKVNYFCQNSKNYKMLIVEKLNDLGWQKFIKENNLEKFNFIKLDEIEIPKEIRELNKVVNKKHSIKCFEFAYNKNAVIKSDNFITTEIDLDKPFTYIIIDHFLWITKKDQKIVNFDQKDIENNLFILKNIGYNIDKLYAFKKSEQEKIALNKNGILFEDLLKAEMNKYLIKEEADKKLLLSGYAKFDLNPDLKMIIQKIDLIKKDSYMKNYLINLIEGQKYLKSTEYYGTIAKEYEKLFGKRENHQIKKEYDKRNLIKQYPLLNLLNIINEYGNNYSTHIKESNIDSIIEYINAMDTIRK